MRRQRPGRLKRPHSLGKYGSSGEELLPSNVGPTRKRRPDLTAGDIHVKRREKGMKVWQGTHGPIVATSKSPEGGFEIIN